MIAVFVRQKLTPVSLKSSKTWLRYEKSKHTKRLNHKPMQEVYEENKELEGKTTTH